MMARPFTATQIMQSAAVATGAGTALDVTGMTSCRIQVTIAASATITFEGSIGSGTMTAISFRNQASGAAATTATATGIYEANIAGLTSIQARISTWGSGAVTAIGAAVEGPTGNAAASIGSNVLGASAGAVLVASTAYEASHVLKSSAGTLVSLVGYNSKGSAQFIQLHNAASVPADAAVPVYTFTVAASSNFSLDISITGAPFTTGIVATNSSTGPAKTVGSADCYFSAVVI